MLKDKVETVIFLDKLEKQLSQYKKMGEVIDDVKLMIQLIRDVINKKYTSIPIMSIFAMLGTLIYLVNPMDFIPDVIPILGQVDDLAAIA